MIISITSILVNKQTYPYLIVQCSSQSIKTSANLKQYLCSFLLILPLVTPKFEKDGHSFADIKTQSDQSESKLYRVEFDNTVKLIWLILPS